MAGKAKNGTEKKLLDRAIAFAAEKHAGQCRKGSTIPYIAHVTEAMEIVSRLMEDEEIRAAAVLYDTLEDTGTKYEELVLNFGKRVADLVAAESENKREGLPAEETWNTRKQETINHLSEAPTEVKMIALGDKLSNIRAMTRDYAVVGEELWKRFNENDPVMQGMYYGLLANAFGKDETIAATPEYREYVDLCTELFSKEYDGDGNLIEEEKEEKEKDFRPGIPEKAFLENLDEWLENPAWKEYFDTAPSDACRTEIALEFWYSEHESDAAVAALEEWEEELSLEDWQHLYRYCGNNPRKEKIHDRIMDIKLEDEYGLLMDIREHPEKYYPLVDHAEWHHEGRTECGDVNIGWNIGLLENNRPWFGECWAWEGITMLTYFISTKDMEGKTPEELRQLLEDTGLIRFRDPENKRETGVKTFTDGNGNEFYSINIAVGCEDETYITNDTGIIHAFKDLNRFNERYGKK